jgi:cyclopropane-fatty-acyl-phospholipid synthase
MNNMTTTLESLSLPWQVRPLVALLERITRGTLELTTPEGYQLRFGDGGEPRADLQLKDWVALQRIFRNGDVGLAECYRDGVVTSDDLTALIRLGIQNQQALDQAIHGNRLLTLGYRIRHLLRFNSRRGSARNIGLHYDLGNAFYQLWLDASMTYSSARFNGDLAGDLKIAQQAKYRRMVEFSGAEAGDSILEIGCGWGGLAEHAATRGIRVQGVTVSREQLVYARERLSKAGLASMVELALRDYRDIDGQYDHIVSIEMLEAVGERYWQTYFQKLNALLTPGGSAAIQTIVIDDAHFEQYRSGTDFIQQYIFPGGMLPSPAKLQQLAAANGFRIARSEYFGPDYAETLRRWRKKFEENLESIRQQGFDDRFIRLWRMYLAYCEAGFDEGRIDVAQLQLVKERAL